MVPLIPSPGFLATWAAPWVKGDRLDRDGPWGLSPPGSSVGSDWGSQVLDLHAPGLALGRDW